MSQRYGKVKGFALPIQTVTLVPCTVGVDKPISQHACKIRAKEIEKEVISLFGGYTSIKHQGGYHSFDKKKNVFEKGYSVTSFATKASFKKNKTRWLRYVKKKGKQYGQETMGIIIENDLHYVDSQK